MKKILHNALQGITIGCTLFTLFGILFDILNGGSFALSGWSYTRMALGGMIVGMGYSIPTFVYTDERFSLPTASLIHLGCGNILMLLVSYFVGWIPLSLGPVITVLVILGMLATAFAIWGGYLLYYKKEANEINEKIKERQQ